MKYSEIFKIIKTNNPTYEEIEEYLKESENKYSLLCFVKLNKPFDEKFKEDLEIFDKRVSYRFIQRLRKDRHYITLEKLDIE